MALFRGAPGLVGRVIRWQTRSRYSHAALVFDRDTLSDLGELDSVYHSGKHCEAEGECSNLYHTELAKLIAIEAREFRGVRMTEGITKSITTKVDLFGITSPNHPVFTPEHAREIWDFAWGQIGKEYDYTMVARFISRRQEARGSSGKWFCSELVFAALQKAGINLLQGAEPWEVSPGLLGKSPLLRFNRTI